MFLRRVISAALVAAGAFGGSLAVSPTPLFAQTPVVPPALAADDLAKAAFEKLPEADRKAIQDALVWTGDYSGTSDGSFGRGTLAAIKAYQTRTKAKVDGILTPKSLATLLGEASRAKLAAGFALVDDKKTGMRIGVPLKLLDQRGTLSSGTVFKSKDGSASLETFTADPAKGSLAELFQRVTTDPSRHVTYKVMRPDFYVVTGDTAGKRFFSRVASGTAGIRGFTFNFPPAPNFDRISIAIANSFVPFPDAVKPAPGPQPPGPIVTPQLPPPLPPVRLTAIAIGPKQLLTAALPESCATPKIGGGVGRVLHSDAVVGLALVERPGGDVAVPTFLTRAGELKPNESVVVLGSAADGDAGVLVAVGETRSPWRLVAPLQAPSGSIVFDRSGALVGLVPLQTNVRRLAIGVAPVANYPFVGASAIAGFLAAANQALKPAEGGAAEVSAGALAEKYGHALVGITCGG